MTRWIPAVAMMLVSVISYIDRNTLALLAPTILRDTHLTNEEYGFIISAFSLAYMFGNPVWGRILDRVGIRAGMFAAVSLWSFASAGHALALGFRSFAAARGVLGFGEGATFPGALRAVVQTLPVEQRSRGIAVSYSGGSLGALITPIIVTPIALAWGWHGAFWFTGAVGALWLALWAVVSRRKDLDKSKESTGDDARLRFSDPKLWAFMSAWALGAFPTGFVLYQSALYLSGAMHKTQAEIGYVLWIPPLGWEIGYFFWGWAIDRYAKAGASVPAMRRQFLIMAVLSLPIALVPHTNSYALTLALFFFAMFTASGFIIGAVAYAASHYPVNYSGLVAGIGAGSWSAVVAVVMPGIGKLFDLQMFSVAFGLTALMPAMSYFIWSRLNRLSP